MCVCVCAYLVLKDRYQFYKRLQGYWVILETCFKYRRKKKKMSILHYCPICYNIISIVVSRFLRLPVAYPHLSLCSEYLFICVLTRCWLDGQKSTTYNGVPWLFLRFSEENLRLQMFCIFKTCIYENSLTQWLLFSQVNYDQHCKQSCTSTYWPNCSTVHQRKEILQHLASLNS